MDDLQQVVGQIVEQAMAKFTPARRIIPIVVLSIAAVTAAACTVAPAPVAREAQFGVNPNSSRYSCYFADGSTADEVIGGQKLHWCGPVPRAVQ
jgi:hypothetical protein